MLIEMDSPPPAPDWPAHINLRKYRHPHDAEAVFRAQDEAFQDHWGYIAGEFDDDFALWKHAFFKIHEPDPELWFLAVDGDEIAGMAICFPHADEDPEMGWVEILCVRKPWRRRGLAQALLHHAFGAYFARGLQKVGLGVDSQNLTGATRLYKKVGMHVHRQQVTYEIELRPGKELGHTSS
jgi:ribosomal protein S18 acetylase RimI-like enzyme